MLRKELAGQAGADVSGASEEVSTPAFLGTALDVLARAPGPAQQARAACR